VIEDLSLTLPDPVQIYESAPGLKIQTAPKYSDAELRVVFKDFRGRIVLTKTYPAGLEIVVQPPGKGYFEVESTLMRHGQALTSRQTSLVVTSPLPEDYYTTPHPAFGVWCGLSAKMRRLGGAKWERQLFFTRFQKKGLPEEYPTAEQIENREPIKIIKCLNVLDPFKRMTAVPQEKWPEIRKQLRQQLIRHKGLVDVWETQNEPMVGENFHGSMQDVMDIIRNTSAVVREIDPDSPIAGICINPMSSNQYGQYLGYYKNFGIERYTDAVMLHPYIPNALPPDTSSYVETLERLSAEIKKISGKDVPLYVSEIGYSTKPGGEVTELQQAAYLTRVVLLNRRIKSLQACVWHNGLWNAATSPRELDFGILRGHPKGSPLREPKPAFAAWATVSRMTYNATYVRDLEMGRGVRVMLFERNQKPLLIAYALSPGGQRLKIPLGEDRAQITDMCGTEQNVELTEGILTLELGEDPVYVAGGDLKRFATSNLFKVNFTPENPELLPGTSLTLALKGAPGMWKRTAKLRVETPDGWTAKAANAQNGWDIRLTAPANVPPGDYQFFFDVREGGRSRYIWQKSLCVVPPVSVEDCAPSVTPSGTRAVELTLKTNLDSVTRLQLRIMENSQRVIGSGSFSGKGKLTIPVENISYGKMNAYQASLRLPNGYQWTAALPNIAPIQLPHASVDLKAPLTSWPEHSAYSLENGSYSKHAVKGAKDLTQGNLYLCWDQQYLYLGAQIQDKYHHPADRNSSLWSGDSLQIGISVAPESMIRANNDGIQETSYAEIGVMPVSGETSWVWASMNRALMELHQPVPGLRNHSTRAGEETIYKIAIPWKTLNVKAPAAGMALKLSVLVNDRDVKGRHWLEWYSGIASGKDPASYGPAILQK
jgi:hypothetical protein